MAGDPKWIKKKPRTGSHGGVGFEAMDRVSDLLDNILHHVLSFLDTSSMVRTSVLSRRWRCLWKGVPVLKFKAGNFHNMSNFRKHVRKLLSRRFGSAVVASVSFNMLKQRGMEEDLDIDTFDSVMKYAASHGGHCLHQLSITFRFCCTLFSELAASIAAHGHHRSLKTLKLKFPELESGRAFGLGFSSLTTLELWSARFCSSVSGLCFVDPFADLPQLRHLRLMFCISSIQLKVSGLQLLDLEIEGQYCGCGAIEVVAPKLKSFIFNGGILDIAKLNVPSLDCANIRVYWVIPLERPVTVKTRNLEYMKLLRGLHNATFLNLRFDKFWGPMPWEQHEFPLNGMKSLMEGKASPFTRLKTLRVQYPQEPPNTPYQVLRYFFDGSPDTEEKSFKFEMKVY